MDLENLRKRAAQQASTGNYWAGKALALAEELEEALSLLALFDIYDAVPDDRGYVGSPVCRRTVELLIKHGKSTGVLTHHDDCDSRSAEPQDHPPQ